MTENTATSAAPAVDRSVVPAPRWPVMPRGLAIVFRLAAHLAAWIPFAVGAIRSVQSGSPVIADGAAITSEAAEERLAGLKQQGRYLLDVY